MSIYHSLKIIPLELQKIIRHKIEKRGALKEKPKKMLKEGNKSINKLKKKNFALNLKLCHR